MFSLNIALKSDIWCLMQKVTVHIIKQSWGDYLFCSHILIFGPC